MSPTLERLTQFGTVIASLVTVVLIGQRHMLAAQICSIIMVALTLLPCVFPVKCKPVLRERVDSPPG